VMTEYENEPIRGLPGLLPKGERILWQGSPDWRVLARTAFHARLIAGYFAVLALVALASGGTLGAGLTVAVGVVGVALLHVLAWASARATIYTLTNRRIVFRIGIALPKCINLPLGVIGAIDATVRSDGSGDLPLHVAGAQRIGYAGLWPHARPWHLAVPQPMLRAIPDAARVGALIARTCLAANPDGTIAPLETPGAAPAYGQAVAA
jgi:Bacterial PH domain